MVLECGATCFVLVMGTTLRTKGLGAMLALAMMTTMPILAVSPVKVSAEVTRPENNNSPVTVTVTNSIGDTICVKHSRAAHFVVQLPGNEQYTISFQQPHCLRKEVVVDGTHALRSGAGTRTRKIAFEVVLDADPHDSFAYAGPVGRIVFQRGTGNLRVERDYAMVKAGR